MCWLIYWNSVSINTHTHTHTHTHIYIFIRVKCCYNGVLWKLLIQSKKKLLRTLKSLSNYENRLTVNMNVKRECTSLCFYTGCVDGHQWTTYPGIHAFVPYLPILNRTHLSLQEINQDGRVGRCGTHFRLKTIKNTSICGRSFTDN